MDTETFDKAPRSTCHPPSSDLKGSNSFCEKGNGKPSGQVDIDSIEQQDSGSLSHQAINTNDPFPIDPDAPVEENQFTFRATIVGCALGAVIAASNVYLGLKVYHSYELVCSINLIITDRLDFRSVPFRSNIWLRDFKAAVHISPESLGRRLLWTQGKQCCTGSCNLCRISGAALYLWFSGRLSIRTASSVPTPRHWPSIHVHDLLRLFWTSIFHPTP